MEVTMKQFDVVALGELLIDFTEAGLSEQGNPLWEANPGGAPCNVLAMLRKLGRSCAFLGKVGADSFGDQLEAACFDVLNEGICTKDLVNLMEGITPKPVNSADFIAAIRERLEKRLA